MFSIASLYPLQKSSYVLVNATKWRTCYNKRSANDHILAARAGIVHAGELVHKIMDEIDRLTR